MAILKITGDISAIAEWSHTHNVYISSQTLADARVICHKDDAAALQASAQLWGLIVQQQPSISDLQRAKTLANLAETTALKAAILYAKQPSLARLALAERAIDCALGANQQLENLLNGDE